MKYIKTFENWFTNMFKSSKYDDFELFYSDNVELFTNYNLLMKSAEDGNLKKFKRYFIEYFDSLNDKSKEGKNVLHYVVTGSGDRSDKKIMIKILFDNNIDYEATYNNENFYDLIDDVYLKKWVFEKYPNVIKKLELIKNTNKYNL